MNEEIINKYTDTILYNSLSRLDIKDKYIMKITENIKEQIYGLIYHWNDEEFRKGLLVIGEEEGKFYKPEAKLDTKSFVVVTIRNSLLEVPFSVDYYKMELKEIMPENYIRLITSEAIEYFENIDFTELSKKLKKSKIDDKYEKIVQKYPMAWEAIKQLGKCVGKKVIYKKVDSKDKMDITNLTNKKLIEDNIVSGNDANKVFEDKMSGISEDFSKNLINQLNLLTKDKGASIFYADCFKMITRNFEKLLKVIDFFINNDKILLTSNYLIKNDYIGKRQELYRASHTNKEFLERLKDPNLLLGISKSHYNYMKGFLESINNSVKYTFK